MPADIDPSAAAFTKAFDPQINTSLGSPGDSAIA
jgi:hypothetical protein